MADVLHESSKRVETLLDRFSAFPVSTGARADAEELVRVVSALYGECLRRISQTVQAELGPRAGPLIEECCADPLVASLMITHELHPVSLQERVRRAVEPIAGVTVLSVSEDLVEVRVDGMDDLVGKAEQAVRIAAPEVLDVRAVGQTISLLGVR
jgi:hypothetical protein